jgi:hypothetical protein
MAQPLNPSVIVRLPLTMAVLVFLLCACRGEPVPRDYQNNPPDMTHPPLKSSQTPSANGMPAAAPQPSTGVEARNSQPVNPIPPPSKLLDQPPITDTAPLQAGQKPGPGTYPTATGESGPPPQNSQAATKTTPVAVTGTHLAPPP